MKWITGALILLLLGCADSTKVPSDIIQQPRMEKILFEMLQADRFAASFIESRKDTLDRNKTDALNLYDKVLSFNNITRQQFIDSYRFYLGRPDLLKTIYDSISVQSERKRSRIYKLSKTDDHKKADSLKIRADSLRNRIPLKNRIDSLKRNKIIKPSPRLR